MNVSATIEANAKTAEVMEPRMRPFDDPAEFTQTTAMLSSALCDHRFDATMLAHIADHAVNRIDELAPWVVADQLRSAD